MTCRLHKPKRKEKSMKQRIHKLFKPVISLALALVIITSCAVSPAQAALPAWALKGFYAVAKKGFTNVINYYLNNCNLKQPSFTQYDDHGWSASLGSVQFNKDSANTGSFAAYQTNIATTWKQSRTRTNVTMYGTKRSFSSGSNYISLMVKKPNGTLEGLARLQSGRSRYYEAYGNQKTLGTYDFIFIYNDEETWDLRVSFNDLRYPDVPSYPQDIIPGTPVAESMDVPENVRTETPSRMYRLPNEASKEAYSVKTLSKKQNLTLQDLIDEKADYASKCEVDLIRHFNVGDTVQFLDTIKSVKYNADRNVTEFKFLSTTEDFRALEFYGDLTNDYAVGDTMRLQFRVVDIGSENGITFESFDYLEDFNFDGDAAPHIEPYLCK